MTAPHPRRSRFLRTCAAIAVTFLAGFGLRAQTLAFRHFDHRDGLPQSQVTCLLEDRNGFIWVGTLDALARLGPNGFLAYGGAQGLKARTVVALMEDARGGIWVASQEAGVAEIRGRRVRNFAAAEGLTVLETHSLGETQEGDILVGTRLGLFRHRNGRFEQVPLGGAWSFLPIVSIAREGSRVWLGSKDSKLASWDGNSLREVALPPSAKPEPVLHLKVDGRGRLWVMQRSRILRREGTTWSTLPIRGLPGTVRFESLSFTPDGKAVLSIGADGIIILDEAGGTRRYTYRDGLPRDAIYSALVDRRGALWVGSNGGGLVVHPFDGLRTLAQDPETGMDLGLGSVTSMLEVEGGRMMLGSTLGLILWEPGRGVVRRWGTESGLPSVDIWQITEDGQGGYWLGTGKGMVRLRGGRIVPGPRELSAALILGIRRHLGRLWVGSDEGLFELTEQGTLLKRHAPPQEVGISSVGPLLPTPLGFKVGTSVGVYQFRADTGVFTKSYQDSPVATANVYSLYGDPDGTTWVGSNTGLYGFPADGGKPIHFVQGKPLQDDSVFWTLRLPSGRLAVGQSRGGVSFLNTRDGTVVHLTRNRGLLSDETNQEAVHLDRQGRLWIGMVGGVSILEADARLDPQPLPPPRVTEASWGTETAWLPERLALPPDLERLALSVDAGLPTAATPPSYQVWVEGLDRGWQDLPPRTNTLTLAQVAPGSYRIRVRATLDGQAWTEGEPLPMQVQRAWHQHPATRTFFVVIGVGFVVLVISLRVKALKRQRDRLEKTVAERTEALAVRAKSLERLHGQLKHTMESRAQLMRTVSHDLRSPLTSILLTSDRLQDTLSDIPPAVASTLNVLVREAHRLEAIVRGLLDRGRQESLEESLNLRLCHPSEVLEGLTDTLQFKAEARDIHASLEVDAVGERVWVLADVTALQQVLFNLLENALKFTPPTGTVGVCSRVEAERWVLEVWDTGRGIAPEQQESIFQPFRQVQEGDAKTGWGLGLSICMKLVEAHQGTLGVESALGRGARFKVTLPLVNPSA